MGEEISTPAPETPATLPVSSEIPPGIKPPERSIPVIEHTEAPPQVVDSSPAAPESAVTETRWDHDKAEDIGHAVNSDPETSVAVSDLELAKHIRERETGRAEAQQQNDFQSTKESLDRNVQRRTNDVERTVSRLGDSLEKLYDSNPDKFANMPTREFMETAREMRQLEFEISEHDKKIARLEATLAETQKTLEASRQERAALQEDLETGLKELAMPENSAASENQSTSQPSTEAQPQQ